MSITTALSKYQNRFISGVSVVNYILWLFMSVILLAAAPVVHERNETYSRAYKDGFKAAYNQKLDKVIIIEKK
ncbi:MAG: hypothetical protein WC055_01950 [Melioribacteraceae bacterium]